MVDGLRKGDRVGDGRGWELGWIRRRCLGRMLGLLRTRPAHEGLESRFNEM